MSNSDSKSGSAELEPKSHVRARIAHFQEREEASGAGTETKREINDVFSEHWDLAFRYCMKFTGSRELSEELAQDVLMEAYRKLPEFRGTGKFGSWIYMIARTVSFRRLRGNRETLLDDGVVELTDPSASVLEKLIDEERASLVMEAASEHLTALEQEAVYLRYVEGIPQERITELLMIEGASGARGLLQ